MQVTNLAGIKDAGTKRQTGTAAKEQRAGREKAVLGKTSRSREVQEKLLQEAEGATVAISAEGLGLVKEETEENSSIREQNEKQMYQDMLENAKEVAESQGEGFGDLAKALEIARRILNGDIVPAQDEKFLMEFNSEMYMRVKSMAELKEDPEKYDSLLEDEEEQGKSGSGSSGRAGGDSKTEGTPADGGDASVEGTDGPDGTVPA